MKLVEFLQGKWLGHPLHPAIVHVPIGTWFAACVLDVLAVWGAVHVSPAIARWLVGVGIVVALVAVAPGLADWSAIKREKPAWKLGLYHLWLNVLATGLWSVNFFLRVRRDGVGGDSWDGWVLATSLAGISLVLVSAYLGSLMVFDQGVGVARLSKKKWRRIAVSSGARVPEENG